MKYAVEMGSGGRIYIPRFVKTGSGIPKLIGGFTNTQRAWCSHKPTFILCCAVVLNDSAGRIPEPTALITEGRFKEAKADCQPRYNEAPRPET
jgi:hypothetical protein